jgi:hypothetical protein
MLGFRKNFTDAVSDVFIREIAERCADAVMAQLSSEIRDMNAAQLRGYVRARAWSHASAEVQDATARGQVRPSEADDLSTQVLEQLVHFVIVATTTAPVIAMPLPHIGRRAA